MVYVLVAEGVCVSVCLYVGVWVCVGGGGGLADLE